MTAAPAFFAIKNWKKFQHYKHRNPPWVKLHVDILTSADWVTLADASRVLAVACMVIGARNEGRVPNDPAYIKRVAFIRGNVNFNPLLKCGFLSHESDENSNALKNADNPENLQADASNTLADASAVLAPRKHLRTNATPEQSRAEAETDTQVSTRTKTVRVVGASNRRPKGIRLAEDWKPSEEDRAYALERNLSEAEIDLVANSFFLYWTGLDCPRPLKRDWPATWKNWVTRHAPEAIRNRSHGGSRSGRNVGYGASVTAATNSILAKAGIRSGQNSDFGDSVLSIHEHTQRERTGEIVRDLGAIVDADEWREVSRPVEGIETDNASVSGNIGGPGSELGCIPETVDAVAGGRGGVCADDAAESLAVVAGLVRAAGTPGAAYLAPPAHAQGADDGLDIPDFLRRVAT